MDPIFSSSQRKHGHTRKAHGRDAPARKSFAGASLPKKNCSSVFSSATEDQWIQDTRRISKNAGFRNKGTFTLNPSKLVEPELYLGKSINRDHYITKSPIQHDSTPFKQETRTRNVGRNDHRATSSLTAILN